MPAKKVPTTKDVLIVARGVPLTITDESLEYPVFRVLGGRAKSVRLLSDDALQQEFDARGVEIERLTKEARSLMMSLETVQAELRQAEELLTALQTPDAPEPTQPEPPEPTSSSASQPTSSDGTAPVAGGD